MPTLRLPRACLLTTLVAAAPASAYSIDGYTDDVSYQAGDVIAFHVATDSPTFDIEIYRDGWTPQFIDAVRGLPGHEYRPLWFKEEEQLWLGANWPAGYSWVVPANWPTGTYLAKFITADGNFRYRPFVVRNVSPGTQSRIAFLTNYNTTNAYNWWGGASLYRYNFPGGLTKTTHVSMRRPFIQNSGRGAVYDFAQPVANQLEADGFSPEYLAELDIHRNPSLVHAYDVIVLAGHHEYISKPIYDAFEDFHRRGGHLAFFSGNDIWWQVRFEGDGFLMVCYKMAAVPNDPLYGVDDSLVTILWELPPVNRPCEALKGITYTKGSLYYDGADFLVQDGAHWAFAGTGLQTGDALGSNLARSETDYLTPFSPPVVDVLLYGRRYYSGADPNLEPFVDAAAVYYEDGPAYGFPNGRGGQVFSAGCEGSWGIDLRAGRPGYQQIRTVVHNVVAHMRDAPRDCNTNGLEDRVEVAGCSAGDPACADCNGNSVPDACDLANCPAGVPSCGDCNADGVPDGCELAACPPGDPSCADCDGNGVPDACDIALCSLGDPGCRDCNANAVPDRCEADCDGNAIADECDIAACPPGDSWCDDCNGNGVLDACETDCDANGVPDDCDIAACPPGELACGDCNLDAIPDGCQPDYDGDGLIDDCDGDVDNDGVSNAGDICNRSAPGLAVRPDGSALGDVDADCDVDLHDFAILQACFTSAGGEASPPCARARIDGDGDVDGADYELYVQTFAGKRGS